MTAARPSGLSALWTRLTERMLVRFVFVGLFNTGLAFSIYALLVAVGVPFPIANLMSLLAGIAIGFFTQGRLVFGGLGFPQAIRFVIAWFIIYAVQTEAIAILVRAGLGAIPAGLAVLPATALLSYVVQKSLVFRVGKGGRP